MSYASSTKKIIHTISKLDEFDEQFTPEIIVQGIPWDVEFKKERHEGEERLNVYLWCRNKDASRDWSHAAFVTVKLLPSKKNLKPFEKYTMPYIFGSSHRCCGTVDFIKWERLINIENGFVRDDTIRVEIKIEVTDPNYEDKSLLKFDVLDKCCECVNRALFRLTVSNIDALMAVGTPAFILFGLRWKISIFNDASEWLGVRLETIEYKNNATSETTATFKLISANNDVKSIKHELKKEMNGQDLLEKWNFVSWGKLFDDQNGFIRNNTIVFDVSIITDSLNLAEKCQAARDQNEDAKLLKLECSICMEAIRDQELSSLPCTHMFCTKCIEDAIKACKKCPICNAAAKLTDLRLCRLPFAN
ncbi:uncharacterized protein LOC116348658 [Contarinia nasturtii]|uniref:uncharacterized protein LOC116348658 n=1 Tax=Contarinia nasturtii TaxID=265458 RepID=UPI0012D3B4F6|nr:uncharacterized protein LOC116348658 [Contarinia nasturtii]